MIEFMKLVPGALIPERGSDHAAGFDLRALEGAVIPVGGCWLVKTGIAMSIPEDVVAMVCPRSGLAYKHGITVLNAPGIVDPDYRGDVGVILQNHGEQPFQVYPGDRIAQLVVTNFVSESQEVTELSETQRGEGGFGSTGHK